MSSKPWLDEFVTFDDGYKYYWPKPNRGALSADNLRQIADDLDEINKSWHFQLEEFMKENPH